MRLRLRTNVGSQPPERSPYYEFVETPVFYTPNSPFISRQHIDLLTVLELRQACMLLARKIQAAEEWRSYNPSSTSAPHHHHAGSCSCLHPKQSSNQGARASSGNKSSSHEEKYDSGVDMTVPKRERSDARGRPHSELPNRIIARSRSSAVPQRNGPPLNDLSALARSKTTDQLERIVSPPSPPVPVLPDLVFSRSSSSDSLVSSKMAIKPSSDEPSVQDWAIRELARLSGGPRLSLGALTGASAAKSTLASSRRGRAPLDNPVSGASPSVSRVPSFVRPKSPSCMTPARDCPDHSSSAPEENAETSLSSYTRTSSYSSHLSQTFTTRHRLSSETETSFSVPEYDEEQKDGEATIDSKGLQRLMTATEEEERHRDLRRAVVEKMFSGVTMPPSKTTSLASFPPIPSADAFSSADDASDITSLPEITHN